MPEDPNNPTPLPAGTEDLESRIGTGGPGAYLQSQQIPTEQPFVQDQSGATLAMGPQSTPPEIGQAVGTQDGIKGLLTNFFGQHGVGGYLMNSFGMPTPEQRQQRQVLQAQKQQLDQSEIQLKQAQAKNYAESNELVDFNGVPVARKALPGLMSKQMALQQAAHFQKINSLLSAAGKGFQFTADPATGEPTIQPMAQSDLSLPQQAAIQQKTQPKTPNEIALIQQDLGPNAQPGQVLDALQKRRLDLAKERGVGYAQGRALYTPFETVLPGTNIPTTISNMQALQTGAPKVSMGAQQKLGGQYALFNDAYGILDKVDQLADRVRLDDPGVSSRVAAGYAALKEPAAKGLTGELLSNIFARQPIYSSMTPDERDLVLTLAQGKAAGTGLRSILGQAGTNEMQQRLDSALFPGGQTAASTAGLKQQTEATRQLLDRFIVGQPQVGLNAPGSRTALQTKRGGGEPARPPSIPPGYKFNAKGPKGAGWYKP